MATLMGTTRHLVIAAAAVILTLPATALTGAGAATGAALTPDAAAALQTVAVDEKTAQDAYQVFAARYGVSAFATIADSEARHREALRAMLAKHSIADGTVGDAAGAFDDASVQSRYDELVARGSASLTNAAEVGLRVERMLTDSLSRAAGMDLPKDATNVVANLLEGTVHHRVAFENLLLRAVTDTPQQVTAQTAQTARVRAQESGRYRVGSRLMLAREPVLTDAGVTVRWRAVTNAQDTCRVRTRDGRSTVTLLKPGVCRVVGYAPAPSPQHLEFRLMRTYRAFA